MVVKPVGDTSAMVISGAEARIPLNIPIPRQRPRIPRDIMAIRIPFKREITKSFLIFILLELRALCLLTTPFFP